MNVNPINLAQPVENIAAEFRKVPANHEVRAKIQNGVMVLYTRPRPTGARRIMQDLFANRKQKLGNAYQVVTSRLSTLKPDSRDAAMKKIRWQVPSAGNFNAAFSAVGNADELPRSFSDFLEADHRSIYMDALRKFAASKGLARELHFTEKVHGLKSLLPAAALDLAVEIITEVASSESGFNIYESDMLEIGKRAGVGAKSVMRSMSAVQWRQQLADKSVDELANILDPFLTVMTTDLQRNLYIQWRNPV